MFLIPRSIMFITYFGSFIWRRKNMLCVWSQWRAEYLSQIVEIYTLPVYSMRFRFKIHFSGQICVYWGYNHIWMKHRDHWTQQNITSDTETHNWPVNEVTLCIQQQTTQLRDSEISSRDQDMPGYVSNNHICPDWECWSHLCQDIEGDDLAGHLTRPNTSTSVTMTTLLMFCWWPRKWIYLREFKFLENKSECELQGAHVV